MTKKQKNKKKNTLKITERTTAFSKEDWYGSSRKNRSRNNKKKRRGSTYHPNGPNNKITESVGETVERFAEYIETTHPELRDNS